MLCTNQIVSHFPFQKIDYSPWILHKYTPRDTKSLQKEVSVICLLTAFPLSGPRYSSCKSYSSSPIKPSSTSGPLKWMAMLCKTMHATVMVQTLSGGHETWVLEDQRSIQWCSGWFYELYCTAPVILFGVGDRGSLRMECTHIHCHPIELQTQDHIALPAVDILLMLWMFTLEARASVTRRTTRLTVDLL